MVLHRLLILLFLTVSFAGSFAQEIKAISFNIRYANITDGNNRWDLRKNDVIRFLRQEEADFIGFQEALLSQVNDIAGILDTYKYVGVGRDDGKEKGEFSPIFYNTENWFLIDYNTFWLSESWDVPSKSWDAALPRICTWGWFKNRKNGSELYVFNTHFDHVGIQSRIEAARLINRQIDYIVRKKNMILVGDFNVPPDSQPVQIITSKLSDAYEIADRKSGSYGTFNGFNYEKKASRRIDYVFLSRNLEVANYTVNDEIVNGRYLSDHFPVIVTLQSK